MTREDPQMKIRLPADLKLRLTEWAATNKRSLNAEIVARLEYSFEPPQDPMPNQRSALDEMRSRIERLEEITGTMNVRENPDR
ncbi:Arc family DNA-binding protein [Xanthobacter autotrophicus]|uniref:Arc family DNA-binding protein n=1 Tax=Xanthobacter autotrophicus TaxID=280 RepID=UPI00372CA76E